MTGKDEEFSATQAFIDIQNLREDAHQGVCPDGILPHIDATHPDGAGGRAQQADHHFNRGAFPRAVWSQEAVKLTPLYGQIQVIDRHFLTEYTNQVARHNGWRVTAAYLNMRML